MIGLKNRDPLPIKIVQFGEGNVLRAFVDWIISQANKRDVFNRKVAIVKTISMGSLDAFRPQDNHYTLITRGRDVESGEINTRTYQQRLEESLKPAIEIIRLRFQDMTECEKIMNKIYSYAGACEDVYMEIGIQCRFTLAMQMMSNTNIPEHDI